MNNKPVFQKRHYEAIALLLHGERKGDHVVNIVDGIAEEFVRVFTLDNPNFQPGRFVDAVRHGSITKASNSRVRQLGTMGQSGVGYFNPCDVGPAMPYYEGSPYVAGKLTRNPRRSR